MCGFEWLWYFFLFFFWAGILGSALDIGYTGRREAMLDFPFSFPKAVKALGSAL